MHGRGNAIALLTVAVLSVAAVCSSNAFAQEKEKTETKVSAKDQPLYLHVIAPPIDKRSPQAKLVVTTRVNLPEDISIRTGSSPNELVAGRIERKGDEYIARLSAAYGTTLNRYHGRLVPEKMARASGGVFGSAITLVYFVLSTNATANKFTQMLEEKAGH